MPMLKAALDTCNDQSRQCYHRISQLVEPPEFVKDAAVTTAQEVAPLQNVAFADPVNRKYPLHTKAATWLAQAYFTESRHLYPTQVAHAVQAKIDKAASYWGIEDLVKSAREALEASHSDAPPSLQPSDFALVIRENGESKYLLPIHSPENIKSSAQLLLNNRADIPYEMRKLAARRILHRARKENIDSELPEAHTDYLMKASALGSAVPGTAASKLLDRVLMLPVSDQPMRERLTKVAKAVNNCKGLPEADFMDKVAGIVDSIDQEYGLTRYYDQGVDTPEEVCFAMTLEKAASIRNNYLRLTTGTLIPFEALATARLDKAAEVLGPDFRNAITADDSMDVDLAKFGSVAATLPLGDAQLLERALAGVGVQFENPELDDRE